ncbi:type VII secretion protein [Streptococcus sp. DD11]|uniref:type VII secretion protein n=1 Tax=Streptococcus sp. DD11 TaxID=1777879 RepID=UPI0010082525|nr:type VII secretion protein [Streptococcus sp. DD11]
MVKKFFALILLLLLFSANGTVYAQEGQLDLKTDSITQKKQRSGGNQIEHHYAPNLFMDRTEQQATKAKTDAKEMLGAADRANFATAGLLDSTELPTQAYRQALFQDYAVSDHIAVEREEAETMPVWVILLSGLFIGLMAGLGVYLGRIFHGKRLFKGDD